VTKGELVRLTDDARRRFPDIGTEIGVIDALDGWIAVYWKRLGFRSRHPSIELEIIESG
jgi:hypothetical protein